jgi:mannose-6-phosphate isomerase-like protein (cupin superfamily)
MARHTDFDPSAFSNQPFVLSVQKPWGYELIFTPPGKGYSGKILHVNAGKRLSLQYHDKKEETIMLLRGRGILLCDNARGELEEIEMEPGKGYSNVPGQRHRLIAIEDCDFLEASLAETGTTYRLEDDSGRAHETEAMRAQERSAIGD